MLGINGKTKAETITIDEVSTESSVSGHHRIKILLFLMIKIDKYIYTCHRNIVSSNRIKCF